MKISKLILIFIAIFNFIYSGPVVGAAACTACCLENLIPGLPPTITDPREIPCMVAEQLISFAPTA